MYASTLRQNLATFNARLGKQAQTLPAAARRSGGGALRPGYNNFSSSLRNRTARAMTTMMAAMMMRGLWTSSRAIGVTPLSVRVGSNLQRASSGSVRWNSGKGEPSWRQWGFEDVCFFLLYLSPFPFPRNQANWKNSTDKRLPPLGNRRLTPSNTPKEPNSS